MALDNVDFGQIEEDAVKQAGEVLQHGVVSYSRGTRSQTHLDPRASLEAAAMARTMASQQSHGISTICDMRRL